MIFKKITKTYGQNLDEQWDFNINKVIYKVASEQFYSN